MKWEFAFLYLLQDMHSPVLDSIMLFFTKMGNIGMPWLGLAVVFLCFKKTRKWGIAILGSLLLKEIVGNLVLKNLIARSRPCWIDTTVPLLVSSPSSYSFPSGHTFDAIAASVSIFLYNKKAGIAAIIVGAIIAFSRMYLFVHFPTDVLASVVLGIVVAVFVHKIVESCSTDNIYKIKRTI
ncbi:MAG: phosphatase PAP2 family protein [Oscillospiraceae bacterium]|nr:phosphatase PAP2 family protein [Oscillospiraceae bacterium]